MKNLFAIFFAIAITFNSVFGQKTAKYSEKHLNIVLRNIGHNLLLHAHDSVSAVLPIKKVKEGTYQIEFQSEISFETDTLISLVNKQLNQYNLPPEYIVAVLNCPKMDLVYGYEVSKKTGNVIPCLGRRQPKGCYIIQIEFKKVSSPLNVATLWWLLPLGFVFYFFGKKYLTQKNETTTIEEAIIEIGKLSFYFEKGILRYGKTSVSLTDKETKLLKILCDKINQTVDREILMEQLWGTDGVVVVGRSLDVMVSKLRKKLELDPAIKIANVHSKGYKLNIES